MTGVGPPRATWDASRDSSRKRHERAAFHPKARARSRSSEHRTLTATIATHASHASAAPRKPKGAPRGALFFYGAGCTGTCSRRLRRCGSVLAKRRSKRNRLPLADERTAVFLGYALLPRKVDDDTQLLEECPVGRHVTRLRGANHRPRGEASFAQANKAICE